MKIPGTEIHVYLGNPDKGLEPVAQPDHTQNTGPTAASFSLYVGQKSLTRKYEKSWKEWAGNNEDKCKAQQKILDWAQEYKKNGGQLIVYFNKLHLTTLPNIWPQYIQHLNISDTNINSLPAGLFDITELFYLDASRNSLTEIPKEIGKLSKLNTLLIGGNVLIPEIPVKIGNLKKLQYLNISDNLIEELPSETTNLTNIVQLCMDNNLFKEIPQAIFSLTALTMLLANYNQITRIPKQINRLTKLFHLSLENNQIRHIPNIFSEFRSIIKINLKNNRIIAPENILGLKHLTELDISGNNISQIFRSITCLTRLHELNASNNQISIIPNYISKLIALKQLNLTNNRIRLLGGIYNLTSLTELNIENNQINQINELIAQLPKLSILDASNNNIAELPTTMSQLTNLRSLRLQHNNFTELPHNQINNLFSFPVRAEIDLRNNNIAQETIGTVVERIRQDQINRQEQGLANGNNGYWNRYMGILPRQIILPPLIQEPANPQPIGHEMQEAINLGMNVHTQVLTDAFKKRIDGLAQQFPEYFQGNTTQKHQEMQTIECRLWGYIFEHSPRNQKTTQQAITIGCTMFKKSYNPDNQYYNDFVYTPGRVLCYVVLSIEAQWLKTPKNQLKEAKRNALGLLIDFLNNGQGFCDTRLIEEILQIVNVPLSQHAAEQATLGESSVALAVSEEQIRDTVFPIAQNTLKTLLKLEEPLEHYVLQYIFFTTVLNSVLKDHPNIPEEPLTNYLNHHILEHWQVFVESVD